MTTNLDESLEDLAVLALLLDEEEKNNQKNNKRKRIWVQDLWKKRKIEGEFATLYGELVDHETKFFEYFRMSQYCFNLLLSKIENDIKKQDTFWRQAITPKERLAVCLRFLATGDSFKTISFNYRLGHSTVYKIVIDTCQSIVKNLMPEVMPQPTEERWKQIANDFWNVWNFPNCLGALDGKLVTIQAPPNSGSNVFNYRKTFSVVLLTLVDANYNFIAVDVGAYDKNSDDSILAHSNLGKSLENGSLNFPDDEILPKTNVSAPYVILGDEELPLKTYLMRPYPKKQLHDLSKRIYNYHVCRTRRVVENCFAILVQKFRFYNRKIQSKPQNVDHIILATCVLHNFIKKYSPYVDGNFQNINEPVSNITLNTIPMQCSGIGRAALATRELYKEFFNSPAGSVSWHNEKYDTKNCTRF